MSVQPWEGRAVHPDKPKDVPDTSELGGSSNTKWGNFTLDEYNPNLKGIMGIRKYDEMRRSDAQIRGTLRLVKTPITAAEWWIQPATNDQSDRDVADFVEWNLMSGLHHPWGRFLWECLSFLDFGYYAFEKIWEWGTWTPNRPGAHSKEVVYLSKLGPRHPMSIKYWDYNEHGEPTGLYQDAWTLTGVKEIFIPYHKLMVFTLDEESDNPEGMSILRSAYKHWYYKDNLYKIDAIQKERHGIGVPDIELPTGFSQSDKDKAEELGRNLRTNEQAHIVRPPGWSVGFVALSGNMVDALKSAEHHDLMIARNVLAQFMNLGSTTSGSRALGGSQLEIFVKALRYVSGIIAQQFNTYLIPQLVDYNFEVKRYPQVRVRRIGENADWKNLTTAIGTMVTAGIITPTPELEEWLSNQMDLPMPSEGAMGRTIKDRVPAAPAKAPPQSDPNQPNPANTAVTQTTPGTESANQGGA